MWTFCNSAATFTSSWLLHCVLIPFYITDSCSRRQLAFHHSFCLDNIQRQIPQGQIYVPSGHAQSEVSSSWILKPRKQQRHHPQNIFCEKGVMGLSRLRIPVLGKFRSWGKVSPACRFSGQLFVQFIQWPLEASRGPGTGRQGLRGHQHVKVFPPLCSPAWELGINIPDLCSGRAGIWVVVSLAPDSTLLVPQHQEPSLCYHMSYLQWSSSQRSRSVIHRSNME